MGLATQTGRTNHNAEMALKVGDKVRSVNGTEGKIVKISHDGRMALIELSQEARSVASFMLDQLTKIEANTSEANPPA